MEGISDIKIIGFDESRPPVVRKEPYINLYFKLSHKAPSQWCADFNELVAKGSYTVKIDSKKGIIIETWVRQASEIEALLNILKESVKRASFNYIARIKAKANVGMGESKAVVSEAQAQLNGIVGGLNFDD